MREKTKQKTESSMGTPGVTGKLILMFEGLEKMSRKQIGARIRALRVQQHRSQESVGIAMRPTMTKVQISRIENGMAPVDVDVLRRLAVAFCMLLESFSDWICGKRRATKTFGPKTITPAQAKKLAKELRKSGWTKQEVCVTTKGKEPVLRDGEKRIEAVADAVREASAKAGKTPAEFSKAFNKALVPGVSVAIESADLSKAGIYTVKKVADGKKAGRVREPTDGASANPTKSAPKITPTGAQGPLGPFSIGAQSTEPVADNGDRRIAQLTGLIEDYGSTKMRILDIIRLSRVDGVDLLYITGHCPSVTCKFIMDVVLNTCALQRALNPKVEAPGKRIAAMAMIALARHGHTEQPRGKAEKKAAGK
jgi:transcriptional regulator with XRE-family HTH domain